MHPKGVTKGGLLNLMAGIVAREEVIFILTTNSCEGLDDTLDRPGQIDRHFDFTKASKEQGGKMFSRVYAGLDDVEQQTRCFVKALPEREITAADLQSHFQRCGGPKEAVDRLPKFIARLKGKVE